ncbi:MAG TPA: HAD family phosphatase [Opitutaceae bacterium]|nr:HAD family phosphatase [Opitutaceae bacterium]
MIRALIFDFDGLILDTETALIDAYEEMHRRHEAPFDRRQFLQAVGQADYDFDPWAAVAQLVGEEKIDRTELERARRVLAHGIQYTQPLRPGIKKTIEDAFDAGYHLGVASNSPHSWVDNHLKRLELYHFFEVIRCRDDVKNPKPAPDLYLAACAYFGLQGRDCLALEDSAHGVHAAKAAGLWCVAIPNPSTEHHDLSHADVKIVSLEETPLEKVLSKLGRP